MNINPFLFIQVLLFISLLFVLSVKSAPFCSIGCAPPTSCTSELSTKCTACATNFKPAGAYPNLVILILPLQDWFYRRVRQTLH